MSGKSNLIGALHFLTSIALPPPGVDGLSNAINSLGGIKEIAWKGGDSNLVCLAIDCESIVSGEALSWKYEIEILGYPRGGNVVQKEVLSFVRDGTEYDLIHLEQGRRELRNSDGRVLTSVDGSRSALEFEIPDWKTCSTPGHSAVSISSFGVVVEGRYDKAVYHELISAVAGVQRDAIIVRPCGGAPQLMRIFPALLRDLEYCRAGLPVDRALVIRDAGGKDPSELERVMFEKVRDKHFLFPRGIRICAVQHEMEAWLIADIDAMDESYEER